MLEKLPANAKNPMYVWAKKRIKANKNIIAIFIGPTGSGKTYASIDFAIKCAEMFGTPWTIQDNMDFTFEGLLKKTMLPQNQKPGTVFLFEEVGAAGSGGGSREWQSKANKFFFSFLQTTRHRNQILLFTTPNLGFMEKGARTLIHLLFEMLFIDARENKSYAKPYYTQTNSRTGKIYYKYLRYSLRGGRYKYVRHGFDVPPPNVVDEYERLKTIFTTKLNKGFFVKEKGSTLREWEKQRIQAKTLLSTGMKQVDIARKLGVTAVTICNWKKKFDLKNTLNKS